MIVTALSDNAMSGNHSGRLVMEAGGAYNRHASLQAMKGTSNLALLEQAARSVVLGDTGDPVTVADYGCPQGKNSLQPMRAAIAALRERMGDGKPISVVHTDLPENDFNPLFRLLDADSNSYLRGQRNLFMSVIGQSFYEALLPPGNATS